MSLKVVRRFDFVGAGALAAPVRLENGWIKVEGRIARAGIQEYQDHLGKTHRELRPPSEVFDPESMKSFEMVPVTNMHPTGLLDANSARLYSVGSVGQALRQDGDWLVAPFIVTDATAIAAAEAGRNELSNGYVCELDETAGSDPVYGAYDAVQRKIRGNHLALVDEARAGHDARVRLDAAHFDADARVMVPLKPEKRPMALTIKLDGRTLEVTEANAHQVQAHIDGLQTSKRTAQKIALKWMKRCDAPDPDPDMEEDEAVKCPQCGGEGKMVKAGEDAAMIGCDMCDGTGKVMASELGDFGGDVKDADDFTSVDEDDKKKDQDELSVEQETEAEAGKTHKDWARKRADRAIKARKARKDARKKAAEAFVAAVERRVDHASRTRAALEIEARKVLGAEIDLAKMDALGIRKAVVVKAFPELKLDGKSSDAIRERYDMAIEAAKGSAPASPPSAGDLARGALRAPAVIKAPASLDELRARVDDARRANEERMRSFSSTLPKEAALAAATPGKK